MLVKDFITTHIPVLKSFDTTEHAISMMDELKVKHLAVVDDGTYKGLLSEKDLLNTPGAISEHLELQHFSPAIASEQHLFEALRLMSHYGLTLLPVVNDQGEYQGCVTQEKVIEAVAEVCQVATEGTVLVLEINPQDYSLTDLARIVESNNAHILSLTSHQIALTGKMIVSLKVDLEDASPVIRSLERFDYNLLYYFMKEGMVDDVLKKRMDELLYYMNL
ncbi:MAG: CBS domain-containing protein [Tannerellaceae bacterium]